MKRICTRNQRAVWQYLLLLLLIVPVLAACGGASQAQNTSETIKADVAIDIQPNQTAFQIPVLGGNESGQVKFDSQEYLESKKVAGKRATISKEWVGDSINGAYKPTTYLYLVDRTPVAVQWTSNAETGTGKSDQSLCAESQESIQVCFQITLAAGVTEEQASTYLYYYPTSKLENDKITGVYINTPIKDVVDTQIRGFVLDVLGRESKKRVLTDILSQTIDIINQAEKEAADYFAKQGITIRYLGIGGEIGLDPDVQKIINALYIATQNVRIAQINATAAAINAETASNVAAIKSKGDAIAFKALADAVGGPENLAKMGPVIEAYRWDGSRVTVQLNQPTPPSAIPSVVAPSSPTAAPLAATPAS